MDHVIFAYCFLLLVVTALLTLAAIVLTFSAADRYFQPARPDLESVTGRAPGLSEHACAIPPEPPDRRSPPESVTGQHLTPGQSAQSPPVAGAGGETG